MGVLRFDLIFSELRVNDNAIKRIEEIIKF